MLMPVAAEAQRRAVARGTPPRHPGVVRQVVVVRGVSYPRYVFFDPWSPYARPYGRLRSWYQYPGPYPGPYGPYGRYDFSGSVRIQVTPSHAQVFVDGYYAGEVDDFDGVFQRLRVRPGGREIAIYLEGHRTMRRAIYVRPGETEHIRGALEPLGPGETSELPEPGESPEVDAPRQGAAEPPPQPAAWFGTLLLRVQPADAEILVDGETWTATDRQDRMAIRLPEGRHRVEVRRDGYARYVEDVLIRRGATLTLNVSLTR